MILTALAAPVLAALIEHPIAPPKIGDPMPALQRAPAIATGDGDFLAAWADARFRTTSDSSYAARLGSDGAPFEEAYAFSNLLSDLPPAVAWNGSEYVVARFSGYGRPFGSGPTQQIVFSTVGKPGGDGPNFGIDATAYQSPSLPPSGTHARMAWNGERYLIVNDGDPVNAFMVDRTFSIVTKRIFALSDNAAGESPQASVTSAGKTFVVAWVAGNAAGGFRIEAAAVSAAGDVGPVAVLSAFTAAAQPAAPAIASAGGRELVVWSDGRSVQGMFISPNATPLGNELSIAADGAAPAVAWNGSAFLVPFVLGDDLYAVRLDAGGAAAAPPFVLDDSPGAQSEPAVAASGSRFVVAWNDRNHIRSAAVDGTSESIVNRTYLPHLLAQQHDVHAVFDGRQITMAWTEDGEVRVGRALPDGTLLDGEGVRVGRGSAGPMATNGRVVLVTWQDDDANGGRGMLIANDEPIADSDPFALPLSPQAAMSDGRDFLLAGLQHDFVSYALDTVAVSATGTLSFNAGVKIFPVFAPPFVSDPVGAWSGSRYAIAYDLAFFTSPFGWKTTTSAVVKFFDESGRLAGDTAFSNQSVYGFAGGSDRFLVATAPSAPGAVTLTAIDAAGKVLGRGTVDTTAPVNGIAGGGGRFWLSYDARAQQVSPGGELIAAPFEVAPPGVTHASMIVAGGSLVTFYLRAQTSITRAFFAGQPLPRIRAARP